MLFSRQRVSVRYYQLLPRMHLPYLELTYQAINYTRDM